MSRKRNVPVDPRLAALRDALDEPAGRYAVLKPGAVGFGSYVATPTVQADEETLTEPILARIIERVLGFPVGAYFPQLGKSGLKPDFTPIDIIAHPFVLDAKGSNEGFGARHVAQIQGYVKQRSLRYGVLFNLRELRVYRRAATAPEPSLSFPLSPLWQAARGETLPGPEVDAFLRFCDAFAYHELDTAGKIAHIRAQPSWAKRLAAGEDVTVDVEFLVEQLRLLAGALALDADGTVAELELYLAAGAGRDERLLHELKQIALDLEPGVDVRALPSAPTDWGTAGGLAERVWRQYLLRVAYLSLTRTLLYRAWEDVQFVDEALYDGGFDDVYTQMGESVRDVLRRAMTFGAERYRTLFLASNNYEWYAPSEPVVVDVLYRLGAVPLGRLDQDALGTLYVSYVDEIDRDRLGQFFTPRDVVRFMLDRAGFAGPDGLFRVEGDERTPLRVLDFATGSGGFLVEAARRIIDEAGIADDDVRGLGEALTAITRGFHGGEISPFPYYLTEINLLLQVSRLLGRLKLRHVEPPPFVLGVLRTDSLASRGTSARSLDVGARLRKDTAELVEDIYDVVPVEDGIHVHDLAQSELRPEHPWPVKFSGRDLPSRVVAHLVRVFDDNPAVVALADDWVVYQGIKTSADAYTERLQRRLSASDRSALARVGAVTGSPIMELPSGSENREPWQRYPRLLARSPEPTAILYGAVDEADYTNLVWIGRGDDVPADVIQDLEPWWPVLATRYDMAGIPSDRWYETARPRDRRLLEGPKVIALYRTDRGRFALDETGAWQPGMKATIASGREPDAPVAYLCGLLNSELLDLWYAVRGKTPWHVRRNYEPLRMNEMPYRRPQGDPRADEIAALVREIATNRTALLPHRRVIRDLGRTIKDPWRTGPVEVDRPALVATLPRKATVSVRLDQALQIEGAPSGKAHRVEPAALAFRRGGRETGRVVGDGRRLDLLQEIVGAAAVNDVSAVLLPRDLDAFETDAAALAATVQRLLDEGRAKVELVERLVCSLYGLDDELTDAVVEHAVARARHATPGDE